MSDLLFQPTTLGSLTLKNRIVMAPMTRSRAEGNLANEMIATYYGRRATAGLIITEGTSPSPDGLGYARIPGLFTDAQVASWKPVTDAVHAAGGRIFVQLMHTGRVGHAANLPAGGRVIGPSAITAPGQMWTDTEGMQDHPVPVEMTEADIQAAITGFADAAARAIEAGFDGVELHGANGYLIDQFLNAASNQRTDAWGGSIEGRTAFALAVAKATVDRIGADRVGIRLSPAGGPGGMTADADTLPLYTRLAEQLAALGLVYVHLVDHSAMGAPVPPAEILPVFRKHFPNGLILSGNYDRARAEADLQEGKGDFVAFGRPFLRNPNLVEKLQAGADLHPPDFSTLYTPGPVGFLDDPA